MLVAILAVNGWMMYARTVRSEVLTLREREFVLAARCVGATPGRILTRHFLPNLASSVVVASTIQVGALIIAESSISFLGFGVQPPTPSWGRMLGEGRNYLTSAWWVADVSRLGDHAHGAGHQPGRRRTARPPQPVPTVST